jgi:secondary thiamine-phosphate synthase enzyme
MVLNIASQKRTQFIEITEQIRDTVRNASIRTGLCHLFVPHTTAAITINENADPSVPADMECILDSIVPWTGSYRHIEGNSAAHLKTSLFGSSEIIAIENCQLVLGVWQGIFLCEFDGPRTRKVNIHLIDSQSSL